MRIAFLGARVPGHLNPMTTLARRLKARGHDVVFISVLDTEPYVRAAQLPFIPYCGREFPLGSVRQKTDQLGKLQGRLHWSSLSVILLTVWRQPSGICLKPCSKLASMG